MSRRSIPDPEDGVNDDEQCRWRIEVGMRISGYQFCLEMLTLRYLWDI